MINYDKAPKWRIVLAVIVLALPAIYKSLARGDDVFPLLKEAFGFLFIAVIVGGCLAAVFVILYFLFIGLAVLLLGKEAYEPIDGFADLFYGFGVASLSIGYVLFCLYYFGVIHF